MARSKKKLNETILKSLFDDNINKIENRNRSNLKFKNNYVKKSSEDKKEYKFQKQFDQDNKYEKNNKFSYPPTQSTRPMLSKVNNPLNMKSKNLDTNMPVMNNFNIKNEQNCNDILNTTSLGISKSKISNNILNNSMNDLIQALKPKEMKQEFSSRKSNFLSVENYSDNLNLDESDSTIIYSFSSKPKPVSFVCNQFPYLISKSKNKRNDIKINKSNIISESGHDRNHSLTNDFLVNFKNHELIDNENKVDSFEALMLHEIKDELKLNNSNSMVLELGQNEEDKYIKQIKSPDLEYFEAYQRGLSDLTNPSEEIQISGKYNFDVLTSSFEETSTSYSKKTLNPKNNYEETNNYQDEMNISLLSNLPRKSINFKDIPFKYSPIQNLILNEQIIKDDIISEEINQLDDSQEDIDEISSGTNEEIDLLYDPTLNCYYDPKTSTYYELNLS